MAQVWMKTISDGIDSASTVPLTMPNQMKAQKSTRPVRMIHAITRVATQFTPWATAMMVRLRIRSASTPPNSAKPTCGIMNDSVTQVRAMADSVRA